MIDSRRARSWLVWSLGGCLLVSCKDPPTDSAASSSPGDDGTTPTGEPTKGEPTPTWADDPMPALRSGTRELKALDRIDGTISARRVSGAEYFELELPRPSVPEPVTRVHVEGLEHSVAVIDETTPSGPLRVLIRAPKASAVAPAELRGTIYMTVYDGGKQGGAAPFVAKGPATKADDTDLEARFFTAFSSSLFDDSRWWLTRQARHPWHSFASARVHPATRGLASAGGIAPRPTRPTTDFAQLMYTTTAATSIQEALQYDRGMRAASDTGAPSVPLAELAAPPLAEHPFDKMLAALPDPKAGEPEPLAAATPAEFWYVRFDDIRVFLRVLDEADTWVTPVTHVFEERAEVHDLSTRYQRQLGLRRTGLAKALGHTVIDRMAIVGSDPYFREGSDVTFVFDVSAQSVFDGELAGHLDAYRAEVPGIATTTTTHGAYTITANRDPAGLVRQHRAQAGDLAIVSNSEAACKAVLDAIDGKRAKLSDQKDLAYMLARDPGKHAGFVFLGDRFIASVVGPAQKVQEARRQRALAELLTPGYAALLYGWLEGKPPADTSTLVASKLLDEKELRHSDGAEIAFTPGKPPSSRWGRPDDLTPLIDLPAVAKVTEEEKVAYDGFSRGYQEYWRNFIDPVAVRLDIEESDGVERAIVDVRVLPLISGTQYSEIEDVVGQERVEVPAIDDGVEFVWAVGADSEMRRELDRAASGFSGKKDIGIGWLGDWVMVGALDRTSVVELASFFDDRAQLPRTEDADHRADERAVLTRVGKLPLFAAAHVRNPVALIATLTALRGMANEVAPGAVDWGEFSKYEDVPIVRVSTTKSAPGEFENLADVIALYYAQTDDTIVFALDVKVLEAMIHRIKHGQGPKRGTSEGPQFVVEAHMQEGKPAWTALLWMLQGQANGSQAAARASAEILLRGDPTVAGDPAKITALGLAYFGSYPVTASGTTDFTLRPEGVADPVHGSELVPVFPPLPVEGSPIAALMDRLEGIRATVAFDREPAKMEPPARSLHTHFELQLGPAKD